MSNIKVMSEVLANKIAAGEVVERLSNVVKELVENSIDANSSKIKIELVDSGIKSIKVIDNGTGMDRKDAVLCFSRHATSKIKNENDLFFISTLGFRGEALASIASISKVELITAKNDIGSKIIIEGGNLITNEKYAPGVGTSIEVKDIFYNTPVRLKFLKSLNTELMSIVSLIEKLSLSHPKISFSLYNNEKEVLKSGGTGNLLKTIHEIYGYNVVKNIIKIDASNYDYEISGYIGNINLSYSNMSKILTFVNNRIVRNSYLNKIIKSAYHTFLPDIKFPIVVLFIESDPTLIDVNIHPTKQDIKFSKMDTLEDIVFTTIRKSINETDNIINIADSGEVEKVEDNLDIKYEETKLNFDNEIPQIFEITEEITEYNKILINPTSLVFGTYLVAQSEEEMYLIDIHAANERINYEKYLDALINENIQSTELLFPINIELSVSEYMKLKENFDLLKELKFEFDEFGINTIRITSHPLWLKKGYEEESIRKIIDMICNMPEVFDRVKFNERLAMTLACKMSVKANTNISEEEKKELLELLFKCKFPYTCPHGRPTIIRYTKYELEKMFKRVMN